MSTKKWIYIFGDNNGKPWNQVSTKSLISREIYGSNGDWKCTSTDFSPGTNYLFIKIRSYCDMTKRNLEGFEQQLHDTLARGLYLTDMIIVPRGSSISLRQKKKESQSIFLGGSSSVLVVLTFLGHSDYWNIELGWSEQSIYLEFILCFSHLFGF